MRRRPLVESSKKIIYVCFVHPKPAPVDKIRLFSSSASERSITGVGLHGNMATDACEKTVDKGFLSELCCREIRAGAVDEKRMIARTESERSL